MKYFEFNKHEYYALISIDENEMAVSEGTINLACEYKAIEIYAEKVAGETAIEVASEAPITQITEEEAKKRYSSATSESGFPDDDFKFEDVNSHGEVILIDGSLI